MIRKLKIISIFFLSAVCSKAQEMPGDSVLRSYFINQKYVYPVDYSRIESLCYRIGEPSSEKISSNRLLLLQRKDKMSVVFDLAEITKLIIDTIKNLDNDVKNAYVYSFPEIYFNTFYQCYIVRVGVVAYIYSDDKRYQDSKWARNPKYKNVYWKTVKEHYFKLEL